MYIYIYIYGCICVVVADEISETVIFGIFWAASNCLEDLPLSILVRKPLKELGPREPAIPEVGGGKEQRYWSVEAWTLSIAVKPRTQGKSISQALDMGPVIHVQDARPVNQTLDTGPVSQVKN